MSSYRHSTREGAGAHRTKGQFRVVGMSRAGARKTRRIRPFHQDSGRAVGGHRGQRRVRGETFQARRARACRPPLPYSFASDEGAEPLPSPFPFRREPVRVPVDFRRRYLY